MIIAGKDFDTDNRTYIMGILNVTPDSFSDGGKFNNIDNALKHVELMIKEGADIIDVGGESTRPGYTMLADEEEIQRVVPIIEAIKKNFDVPISIDTYKSNVAKAAITAGADIVNDIWGLKYDEKMANTIAESNSFCCLMHNRKDMQYVDFFTDMLEDLRNSVIIAKNAGIKDNKIIIDPGVGFAKTYENNIEVINCVEQLHVLGYPVLLATSRKSVIGLTLDLPSQERVEGTLVTTVMAVMKGCSFVRVHDIKENKRAIIMTEKIIGKR